MDLSKLDLLNNYFLIFLYFKCNPQPQTAYCSYGNTFATFYNVIIIINNSLSDIFSKSSTSNLAHYYRIQIM